MISQLSTAEAIPVRELLAFLPNGQRCPFREKGYWLTAVFYQFDTAVDLILSRGADICISVVIPVHGLRCPNEVEFTPLKSYPRGSCCQVSFNPCGCCNPLILGIFADFCNQNIW